MVIVFCFIAYSRNSAVSNWMQSMQEFKINQSHKQAMDVGDFGTP
jgi:hypothetical protein